MKLYLVRHGEADSDNLTEQGRKETESVGNFLKKCPIEIDEIIHSVKNRAKQTAEILGKALAPDVMLVEREGLKPMDPIEPILEDVRSFERNVMLVGHLPFMEKLLTTLLFKEECLSPVEFVGSCIACLNNPNGEWTISWVVSPSLILA